MLAPECSRKASAKRLFPASVSRSRRRSLSRWSAARFGRFPRPPPNAGENAPAREPDSSNPARPCLGFHHPAASCGGRRFHCSATQAASRRSRIRKQPAGCGCGSRRVARKKPRATRRLLASCRRAPPPITKVPRAGELAHHFFPFPLVESPVPVTSRHLAPRLSRNAQESRGFRANPQKPRDERKRTQICRGLGLCLCVGLGPRPRQNRPPPGQRQAKRRGYVSEHLVKRRNRPPSFESRAVLAGVKSRLSFHSSGREGLDSGSARRVWGSCADGRSCRLWPLLTDTAARPGAPASI